jgi:hypothetical protein
MSKQMNNNIPNVMVSIVEPVCWRVQHVILAHLTDPGVFAVCVSVKLAFETVVLNFSGCFA